MALPTQTPGREAPVAPVPTVLPLQLRRGALVVVLLLGLALCLVSVGWQLAKGAGW